LVAQRITGIRERPGDAPSTGRTGFSERPFDACRITLRWRHDRVWCRREKTDFLPVLFPGFSWHNLKGGKLDQIPRLKGEFLWSQVTAAKREGCDMIYVAMFDPRKTHPEVVLGRASPGASPVTDADTVENFLIVVDERGVDELVGVYRTAAQFREARGIEYEVVDIERYVDRSLDHVEAGFRGSLRRKTSRVSLLVHSLDVEHDPGAAGKGGNLAFVDAVTRLAAVGIRNVRHRMCCGVFEGEPAKETRQPRTVSGPTQRASQRVAERASAEEFV
jgi:hypothetical protein